MFMVIGNPIETIEYKIISLSLVMCIIIMYIDYGIVKSQYEDNKGDVTQVNGI